MYGFNMSGNLLDYGYGYLSVAGIGLGLNLILFIFSSYFKSVERTKIILVATLSSCAINLCIDYVLVFGKMGFPKMGVIGAAIGTVIGLLINVVIYIIGFGCYSKFKYRFWVKLSYMKPVLKSYIPLLGQDFIESTAFAIVLTMIIARLGSESIGTYGLVNILLQAVVLPIYAYCSASMTITSKAYGASDFHVMKQVPSLIIRNLIIMIGILGVLIFGFADQVPRLITNDMTIISFVSKVMGIALLSQAFNMANQVYRYGLNALNDEKWVLYYSSVVSFVSLVVIYAFAVPLRLGLKGVFVGLGINYLMHSIGFYGRYKRKTETIAGVSIAECNRIVN